MVSQVTPCGPQARRIFHSLYVHSTRNGRHWGRGEERRHVGQPPGSVSLLCASPYSRVVNSYAAASES